MAQPYIVSATALSDMNKSQETTVFGWHQKLTSAMKQRPEMVDFKFDALYR